MKLSCGYSFLTSTRPVRISSQRGLRKKSSSTRNSDSMPWKRIASRTPCTTAPGSRDLIVLLVALFTMHDRLRLSGAHRTAHHVLHTGVPAGERTAARGVDGGFRFIEEARKIAVV